MGLIVCKFGGTSLADAAQFDRVRRIVHHDPRRRLIIASAPGRRAPDDTKITDLLIGRHLSRAQKRLQRLADDTGAPVTVDLPPDAPAAFLASRGEYYCARILAHALGFAFADAADFIRFDSGGTLAPTPTADAIRLHIDPERPTVVPGFYGALPDGTIRTLPRGGSDTTGALTAAALNADLYENFTDVPGLFDADPNLVPNAQPIPFASYDEVRLLAHCGANVLHEDAISPVQKQRIPIRLCSTFAPDLPGTRIAEKSADRPLLSVRADENATLCAITGIIPKSFPSMLRSHYPDIPISPLRCGLTFRLPSAPSASAIFIHRLLHS